MLSMTKRNHALTMAVVVLATTCGAVQAQSEIPVYEIVDLGTFGSPGSETYATASGLNERGDVTGAAEDDDFAVHVFLYRDGELIDLGGFEPEYLRGSGLAVNIHGQVAGRSIGWSPYWKFPTWVQRPFLGTASATPLDPASGVGIDGDAFGINDRGQMAVTLNVVPDIRAVTRAHVWDPQAGLREIEFPSQPEGDYAQSTAWAINQEGHVAGAFVGEDLTLHAYVWDPETNPQVTDLGFPGSGGSGVYNLNDLGDAAGWILDGQGGSYAIVWTRDGGIVPIFATLQPGLTSSTAEGINNLGDVVGWDGHPQQQLSPKAWVAFEAAGGGASGGDPESIALEDLLSEADRAEWDLWLAAGINDARQIVGYGVHNGLIRAFLMSPPCPDNEPPQVELLEPLGGTLVVPSTIDFDVVFRSSDEDGGEIVHEVLFIDDCPAFDGDTYGDGDGLLSDEELHITHGEFCRVAAECGFDTLVNPEIRVEVTDCGGSVASDAVSLQGSMRLVRVCETVSPATPQMRRPEHPQPGRRTGPRPAWIAPEHRQSLRETPDTLSRRD